MQLKYADMVAFAQN